MNVKISIITATYNCASTLRDTIESISNQTAREHIEYIIIDGSSDDGTVQIIKDNSNQIDHWISEADNGIYDALNKGLQMATGDWIGFLHADDIFASDQTIEKIIETAEEKEINAIYGNLQYVQQHPPHKVIRQWISQPFQPKLLKRGWMPPHPTVYITRNHYKTIGLFNVNYQISADYDLMLKLFSHPQTKSMHINEVLIKMKIGGASNRSIGNIILKSKEDFLALKRNKVGGIYSLVIKNLSKVNQFFYSQA
ncbi:MAG: glycosyltransferase [Marinilabiliaceae bacterium]|nr:glycosyltransferase [Marinilabiliaceae bacterium]